jgi:hypothetical protein
VVLELRRVEALEHRGYWSYDAGVLEEIDLLVDARSRRSRSRSASSKSYQPHPHDRS